MALEFGWAWCRSVDRKEDPKNKSPESLKIEKDTCKRRFFSETLPWVLMYVGIPMVTETTIPAIAARLRTRDGAANQKLVPGKGDGLWAGEPYEEFLEAFIGFSTNAPFWSDTEFLKVCLREFKNTGAAMSSKGQSKARWELDELRRARMVHLTPKMDHITTR